MTPSGLTTPNKVQNSIRELDFFDGVSTNRREQER